MLKKTTLILSLYSGSVAWANSIEPSDLTKIKELMHERVLNKRFVTEYNGEISNGRLYTEFKRTLIYSDLMSTKSAVRFNAAWIINQKNYTITNGERSNTPDVMDRVGTYSCEIALTKSTGQPLGFCRNSFDSRPDQGIGGAQLLTMTIEDGNLIETKKTVGYTDCFAEEGKYRPCTVSTKRIFSADGDKFLATDYETYSDVNIESFQPVGESTTLPALVSIAE